MSTTTPEYTLTVDQTGAHLHWQGQTFEIEARDLRDAGWEFEPDCDRDHCGDGDCPECPEDHPAELGEGTPREVIERWHAEMNHFGALQHCDERPCKDLVISMGLRW